MSRIFLRVVITKDFLASVQETYMHLWAKTKFGMQFAYDQYNDKVCTVYCAHSIDCWNAYRQA